MSGFFASVADRSLLLVLLKDIPALTGQILEYETIVNLADHNDIVGIKITSSDLLNIHNLVAETSDESTVLGGSMTNAIATLNFSADRIVSGRVNVVPEVTPQYTIVAWDAHAREKRGAAG